MKLEASKDTKSGVITLKVTPTTSPRPSSSGKSLTLFSTGGIDKATLSELGEDGQILGINLTLSDFGAAVPTA